MEISIHALTVDRVEDFLAFFDGPAFSDNVEWSGCYCFFPYHDPTTGPWGARSATENRQARIDGVNDGTVSGLLAYHEGEVVGWCNVNRRDAYPHPQSPAWRRGHDWRNTLFHHRPRLPQPGHCRSVAGSSLRGLC